MSRKKKKLLVRAALLACAVLCICLAGRCKSKETEEEPEKKEKEEEVEKEKLVVALSAELPPYGYYEGEELVGMDVELAAAVADKLDMQLVVKELDMEAILPAVTAGEADFAAAGLLMIDERRAEVDFTDSYGTGNQVIIVKDGSEITGQEDLAVKRIGVQQGTSGDIYATEEYGVGNVRKFAWGTDTIQAIYEGEIDAAIVDVQTAKFLMEDNDRLKILETDYVEEEYAFALKKGNDELCGKINEALAALKTDGTFETIMAKYRK